MTSIGSPLVGRRLGVVGAHGAVGRETLFLLLERGVAPDQIRAFGSPRRSGETVVIESPHGAVSVEARPLQSTADDFAGLDGVVFAADSKTAREHAPRAVRAGAFVVDNSSAFRMDPETPLAVPEIETTLGSASSSSRLFANPNCSTILAALALDPLHRAFELRSVSIVTYQAISGAGQAARDELMRSTRDVLDGRDPTAVVLSEPTAFNVFPHESPVDPDSLGCEEELKIVRELRRILQFEDLAIDPFCVRVPVERCHSQAIRVTFAEHVERTRVEEVLANARGLRLELDHPPTPLRAQHQDMVLVGKVRPSLDAEIRDGRTDSFRLWLCGDQLRKGAATNAIQVLERALGAR